MEAEEIKICMRTALKGSSFSILLSFITSRYTLNVLMWLFQCWKILFSNMTTPCMPIWSRSWSRLAEKQTTPMSCKMSPKLKTHSQLLSCMDIECSGELLTFRDICKHFRCFPNSQALLLSQVSHIVKFVPLMPATNSVSERSASALRRIKMYLRSAITQSRLNNVMVIHIHKDLTDSINHLQVLDEFSSANKDKTTLSGNYWNKLCCNHMLGRPCKLLSFCAKYSLDAEVKGSKWLGVPRICWYRVPECKARGFHSNEFEGL